MDIQLLAVQHTCHVPEIPGGESHALTPFPNSPERLPTISLFCVSPLSLSVLLSKFVSFYSACYHLMPPYVVYLFMVQQTKCVMNCKLPEGGGSSCPGDKHLETSWHKAVHGLVWMMVRVVLPFPFLPSFLVLAALALSPIM